MAFNVRTIVDRESELWKTLRDWPKIELHRHLEGAVRLTTLIDVARTHENISLPTLDVEQLRPFVQITEQDEASFSVFLSKFEVLRQFYRSLEIVERIAYEAVEDAANDNVRYMELRFTPHALIQQNNYRYKDVIAVVCDAVTAAAEAYGVRVRLIASVNRHESVEIAEQVLEAVLSLERDEVVAMDLAGREYGHSALPFKDVFQRAKETGLSITIHAGEWDGPENVQEAILDVGADRIGHGVRAVEDSRVVQLVRDRAVTLEVCPISNLHSGVVARMEHHPLLDLSYLNVITTLNTDDPSISDITLTDELVLAHVGLGLPLPTIKKNILNATQAAFLPNRQRADLLSEFRTALGMDETLLRPPGLLT